MSKITITRSICRICACLIAKTPECCLTSLALSFPSLCPSSDQSAGRDWSSCLLRLLKRRDWENSRAGLVQRRLLQGYRGSQGKLGTEVPCVSRKLRSTAWLPRAWSRRGGDPAESVQLQDDLCVLQREIRQVNEIFRKKKIDMKIISILFDHTCSELYCRVQKEMFWSVYIFFSDGDNYLWSW